MIIEMATQGCAAENGLNELILAEGFGQVVLLLVSALSHEYQCSILTSIWAARHFSRSPTMACAVRAITGVEGMPFSRSHSRILAVASKPPWAILVLRC